VKKTKRAKSEVPIYATGTGTPPRIDTLATSGMHAERLAYWVEIVQRTMADAKPNNDEARQFAEECRTLWPHVIMDAFSTPSTQEDICSAMVNALELGYAFHAFTMSNNFQAAIQSAWALRDGGKRGAAKRHDSVREKKRKTKRADALRLGNEWRKGGVSEELIAKRLSGKLGVKLDTAKKMLRKSGQLRRPRRDSSP
jgi:hypothetical protein